MVKAHQRAEIGVGEVVAADHDERVVEPALHLLEPAGAAGQLALAQIAQLYAVPAAVAERALDQVGEVEHVDCDLVVAVRRQPAHYVAADRFAGDRHDRLRYLFGERVEPRAHPAGQDHRLHADGVFRWLRAVSASLRAASAKRGSASWRRQRRGSLAKRYAHSKPLR